MALKASTKIHPFLWYAKEAEEAELEIRPVFEAEDFGAEFTPELRENDEKLRAEIERQRKS